MKEAEWQKIVLDLMKLHGWKTAHFGRGLSGSGRWMTAVQGGGKGFPDIVAVRGIRLLFVELKMDGKYLRPEQRGWAEALSGACSEVYCWRPKDLEVVERCLRRS